MNVTVQSDFELAAGITRAASRQTDLTIRYLVDRGMVENAYRTYGYFRWVDDWLDQQSLSPQESLAFITRQQNLMEACYLECGNPRGNEESMLVNLIASDREPDSGLQAYIRNMMAVMAFDANRRGRLISETELETYTRCLAVAVTEAMHHFIGHSRRAPKGSQRYQAVIGAHITHMLRDTLEDAAAGYYNIPSEVLAAHQIKPDEIHSPAYKSWVKTRVQQARKCFQEGRIYLAQVESPRCRLAGYAYMHRFERVLTTIEREVISSGSNIPT